MTMERLIAVPQVKQLTDYTCGVAALQAILEYFDCHTDQIPLARELHAAPLVGTSYRAIERYCLAHGFNVEISTGMAVGQLKQLIAQGQPVICLIQARQGDETLQQWPQIWQNGHYVVAVGADDYNFYFMDPSLAGLNQCIGIEEFSLRWHDIDEGEQDTNTNISLPEKLEHFAMVIRPKHC